MARRITTRYHLLIQDPAFDDASQRAELLADMPEKADYDKRCARMAGRTMRFIGAVHCLAILTRQQEAHQFRKYHYLRYRAIKFWKQKRKPEAQKWLAQADQLRNELVMANLLLLARATKNIPTAHWSEDLFEELCITLMRTVEHFDWRRNCKFSTYACHALQRRVWAWFMKQKIWTTTNDPDSHEQPRQEKESEAEKLAIKKEQIASVRQALSVLNKREQEILRLRFFNRLTLQAIAERMGLTRERIRQIEAKAIRKLREELEPGDTDGQGSQDTRLGGH